MREAVGRGDGRRLLNLLPPHGVVYSPNDNLDNFFISALIRSV